MAAKNRWEEYNEQKAAKQSNGQQDNEQKSEKKKNRWEEYQEKNGGRQTHADINSVANNIIDRVNTWLNNHNNYIKNYQSRYSGRKYSYEDSYVSDSGSWLDTVSQQKDAFKTEAESILAYMDQYSSYLDAGWMKSVMDTLINASKQQSGIVESAGRDNEYWKMFNPNEEQTAAGYTAEKLYSEWQASSKQYANDLSFDVTEGEATLEKLKKERDDFLAEREAAIKQAQSEESLLEKIGRYLGNTPDTSLPVYYQPSTPTPSPTQEYDIRIAELEEQIKRSKYVQGYEGYMSNMDAEDYAAGSQYVSTRTGVAKEDALGGVSPNVMYDTDKLFGDFTYDYINGNQDARSVDLVNDVSSNAYFYGVDKNFLKTMTKDEVGVYNYIYKTQGQEAAGEFLKFIEADLTARQRAQEQEYWAGLAKQDPVGTSAFSVMTSPLKAMTALGQVTDYLKDGTIDQNAGYNRHSYRTSAIRNQVAIDIEKSGKWGKVGSWTYQLGMSMGDFLMNTAISGGNSAVSLTLMGSGAMADTVIAAKDRGLDDDQAMILGVVAGAAEIVTEKFSLDALFKGGLEKGAMRYILNNAFVEGTEEVGASVINLVADVLVSKEKSEWQKAINDYLKKNPNATEQEAFQSVLGDAMLSLGLDFLGGFLMGGTMGSGGAVVNYVTQASPSLQVNKDAVKQYGESTKELIAEGLASDPNSRSYDLAKYYEKKTAKGKSLSGYEIRSLVEANEAQFAVEDYDAAVKTAKEKLVKLGESKNIDKIAKLVAKKVTGQDLTRAEIKTLVNSFGSQVAEDMTTPTVETESGTKRYNATYKSLEDRVGTESRYGVSESGTATIRESNEEISLDNVEVVKTQDGQLTVKLEDGREVYAGDIDFADDTQSYAFSAVADIENITPAAATAIIRDLDLSKPVGAQLNGIDEAYTYGYHGYSVADLKAGQYTSNLTNEQMMSAYKLGQSARTISDVDADAPVVKMRTAAEKAVSKKEKVAKQKAQIENDDVEVYFQDGKSVVKFDEHTSKYDDKRTAAVNTAKFLSKLGIGGKYYFFESYVNADGDRVYKDANGNEVEAPNGMYKDADGSIHIDLNAGNAGQGTALFTMGHELTHFIKAQSKKQFKVLGDLVAEAFDKTNLSMHERVVEKQEFLSNKRGHHVSYNEAYEEVVADAMSTMLTDGSFYDKLMEIKVKDKGLFNTIKRFFEKMIAKFNNAYKELTPDQKDAQDIREMKDMFDRIQTAFAEALVEASDNFHAAMESVVEAKADPISADEIITDGAVVTDGDGVKHSIRSMKADIAEGKMFEDLKTYCGWTQNQVNELRQNLENLVEYMTPNRNILDMNESYGREGRRFSPYKPNSDPLYKISMDFSTLCSKRLLTQYVIENLQLRENRPMSAEEQMAIRDMLNEYRKVEKGLQVACAMCYVEAARLKSPKQIQRWLDDPTPHLVNYFALKNTEFNASVKEAQADFKESRGYDRNAPKKDMKPADVKELNKIGPRLRSQYKLSAEEQSIVEQAKTLPNSTYLTAGNLANLSETNPAIYDAYTAFVRTATRSKSLETDEPYYYGDSRRENGNGIIVSDSFIEAVNRENGMRFSSWSDWRIQHMLDYITAVIDNSVRGAAMHGYTKFGEEVRVLGKTGMMFNMSGVAGTQTGLNEDGSLSFSDTESIDVNEAIQLREEFPETAGLQCIGVSDAHITELLRSDIIDYVIPYHVSGLNAALRRMADIHGWKDYTGTQHAAIDKSIKFENAVDKEHWHEEPVFSEFFVGYDTGMTGIEAMKASAEKYKQMCKDRGLKPKFEQFAKEENYWKLLIDRKMINQQTGKLIQQRAVTPTFDFDTIKGVVDKFVDNYDAGLEARALNHIVENWDSIPQRIKDLKKGKAKKAADTLANQTLAAQPADNTKFSMRESVEETNDLLAYHNITAKLLLEALSRNGLLMPSLAVTNKGMTDFGEISLLFDKATIDPILNSLNKLYGADAWTPTQTLLKKNAKFDTNKTVNAVNALKNSIGSEYVPALFNITAKQFRDAIVKADGSIYDAYAHNIGVQTAYAMEQGIISEIPTNKDGSVNKTALQAQLHRELDTDNGWRQYKKWLNNISDTVITSYDKASNQDILKNMKAQPATAKTFKLSETGELVVPAVEYSSIDEVRKNKNRLSENAAEATKAVADEFLTLAKKIGGNTKAVVDAINATFANRYSTADIVKSFNGNGIQISNQIASELQSLYKKAVELPTQYFEAKPGREIGFDEVKAVVMPTGTEYAALKSKLEDLGISVVEYKAGSKGARVKALNSVEDVKFSERDTGFKEHDIVSAVYTIRNEKAQRGHDLVKIGSMPTIYRDLFDLSGDVFVSTEHMYQNMVSRATAEAEGRFNTDASADYHELGETKVINAIDQFQDPLVIMESLKDYKEPRLVAVLDEKGNDGQNLLAVMELYAPLRPHGISQLRNHVLITIYEKNSLPNYIEKTVDKNRILHKKEGPQLTSQAGLRLAGEMSNETLKKNVARFNKKVKDFKAQNKIYYSERDSSGKQLSEDQQEFFEKSVVRDEQGRLKVLFHGSRSQLFTEFDVDEGVWLTPDQRYAEVYAEKWHSWRGDSENLTGLEESVYDDPDYRLYKMYANITNPLDLGEINDEFDRSQMNRLAKLLGVPTSRIQDIAYHNGHQTVAFVYEVTRDYQFIEIAREQGFDGFKATEKGRETWCAFSAPNQVKLTTNEVPSSFYDIRYSDRDYVAYDRTAILKESKVDEYLNDYAAWSSPKYAQAYITYMRPRDFLKLTTTGIVERYYIDEQAGDLDAERLSDSRPGIYLRIDHETGKVTGHEGRHRMSAMGYAGIDRVPVLLVDESNNMSKTDIDRMYLHGQFDETEMSVVTDAIPLSVENRSRVVEKFASQSSNQRIGEKIGYNKTLRFQDRAEDAVSNRSLLANAFEGITNGSEEYKLIQKYKGYIAELNSLENKLSEFNRQIREIRFGEGKYDAEKLKKLESEAKKIAEAINKYDQYLLSLEASKPLRKIIEQERKKEAQKTKDHVKEIQQNKKLRAEQTEIRHKIRKAVRDLDKLLNRGNKKLNVKEDMKGFASQALELADYLFTDHISNDELIRKGITVRMTPKEAALVKETEDILTKLYDHADSLTDEEFTRLDAKRKANEDKLRDLLTAQRNERLSTPVYQLFDDLVKAYASLKNSSQDAVKAAYDEELEKSLRAFMSDDARVKILENMRVADMTTEELNWLYRAYTMVLNNVRNANKFHVKGMTETIDQKVGRIVSDFGSRKIPNGKVAVVARNLANKIGWDYEKLYYALDRIGSEAFTELIMNLANSENIVMQDVMEATAFRDEIVEKYGFNNWSVNKEIDREFLDNTGKKFKLTLGQMMALYAYSRREGAWDHIEYGGFVFGEAALTNPRPADSYKLSKAQCEAITDLLTKDQKGYVEAMQKYLSETMGAKGNEVSMMLYGIKMFGEKNYFPIHVAGQFKAQAQESQAKAAAGFGSMSNAGFTHAQNPNAKAPFVLEGFNEIWVDHVNEMSRYHGTVPALEDIRRVMNRSSYSDAYMESMSVKAVMENAFGKDAVAYFDNLYREANSGAIQDKLQRKSKKLLSLFRKGSVAYSLSVVIQQPSAIKRAYAMIDPKYFGFKGFGALTSGVAKAVTSKWNKAYANTYNKMLKYAPGVTMAKEIGGFDTHTGTSIREYLLDTNKGFTQKLKTGTVAEKGKAVLDVVDNNAIANLPNVADKIAWMEIWNACERETVAKHKDLMPGSDEFLQTVGDRFTEVIRATQVYDSIFSKSPMLKSKNLAVQYLVSFMNEPNTTANMVEKAVRDAAKGDWKSGFRTAAAVTYSIIFNNVLKSIIYAMRDDDEDETYQEKYIEAMVGNLMSDFNPLSYIPIARDAWSIAQGYDVERADMAIIADALDALGQVIKNGFTDTEEMTEEQLVEFDKKVTEANWKLVESIASFFGIPVKNIRREIEGVIDHARIASANAGKTTPYSAWVKFRDAVIDSIPFMSTDSKQDKLYDAIISGDKAYVERLKAGYKDEDAWNSAVRKALRDNDPRIREAAMAYYNGNIAEYKRIFKEIRNDDKQNIIGFDNTMEAVMSEVSAIKGELEPKTESSAYNATDFVNAVLVGSTDLALTMREDIISYKVAHGATRAEAEDSFADSVSTATRNAFDSGLLDEAGTEKMLMEYAGMDEEEAAKKTSYWAFIKAHPQYRGQLSQSNVEDYHEFAEPAEIPLDVFVQFLNGTKGLGTKYDQWGDVEKTKKEQVLEVIDSLPLTWQQKDALYLAAGYAESTLWDVPW